VAASLKMAGRAGRHADRGRMYGKLQSTRATWSRFACHPAVRSGKRRAVDPGSSEKRGRSGSQRAHSVRTCSKAISATDYSDPKGQTDRHIVAVRAIRLTVSISMGALNGFSIRISSLRSTGSWPRSLAVRNINGMLRARRA